MSDLLIQGLRRRVVGETEHVATPKRELFTNEGLGADTFRWAETERLMRRAASAGGELPNPLSAIVTPVYVLVCTRDRASLAGYKSLGTATACTFTSVAAATVR